MHNNKSHKKLLVLSTFLLFLSVQICEAQLDVPHHRQYLHPQHRQHEHDEQIEEINHQHQSLLTPINIQSAEIEDFDLITHGNQHEQPFKQSVNLNLNANANSNGSTKGNSSTNFNFNLDGKPQHEPMRGSDDSKEIKRPQQPMMIHKIIKKVKYVNGPPPKSAKSQRRSHVMMLRPVRQPGLNNYPVKYYLKPSGIKTSASSAHKILVPVALKQHTPPAYQPHKWTSTVTLPSPNVHHGYPAIAHPYQYQLNAKHNKKLPNSYVTYKAAIPKRKPQKYHHTAPAAIWQHPHHETQIPPQVVTSQSAHAGPPSAPGVPQVHYQEDIDGFTPVALPQNYPHQPSAAYEGYASPAALEYTQSQPNFAANQYAVEEQIYDDSPPPPPPNRQPKYYFVPNAKGQAASSAPASPSVPPTALSSMLPSLMSYLAYPHPSQSTAILPTPAPQTPYQYSHQLSASVPSLTTGAGTSSHSSNTHFPSLAAIQQYSSNYLREEAEKPSHFNYQFDEETQAQSPHSHISGPSLSNPWAYQSQPQLDHHQLRQKYSWKQKTQDGALIEVQSGEESRPEAIKVHPPGHSTHEVMKKQVTGVSSTQDTQIGVVDDHTRMHIHHDQQTNDDDEDDNEDETSHSQMQIVNQSQKQNQVQKQNQHVNHNHNQNQNQHKLNLKPQQDSLVSNGWTPIINN